MYTLRTIDNNIQENVYLGNYYNVIERHANYDEFCNEYKKFTRIDHKADLDDDSDENSKNIYAFINSQKGNFPLFKNSKNYIITESGKTFSNLSYK